MRTQICAAIAWSVAASLTSGAAFAAADFLLQIGGAKGDMSNSTASVEVQSFSFGASNPTSTGSSGMSAGKVSMQDISMTSATVRRDSATGHASGKRVAPVAVSAAPGGADTAATTAEPKPGEVTTLILSVRESPTLQSACATGTHFPSATLSGKRTVQLSDVSVSSCAVDGEMRKYELTGHVTLMK